MDVLDSIDLRDLPEPVNGTTLENVPWIDDISDTEVVNPEPSIVDLVRPKKRRPRGLYTPLDATQIESCKSRLSISEFERCRNLFRPDVTMLRPNQDDVVTEPPEGDFFGIHTLSMRLGFRLPMHPFIIEFLGALEIPPCQLTPFGHQYLVAFLARCKEIKAKPSLDLFKHLFRIGQCSRANNLSWVSVSQRAHLDAWKVSHGKIKNWKEEFIFVSTGHALSFPTWFNPNYRKFARPILSADEELWSEKFLAGGPFSISTYTTEDHLSRLGFLTSGLCSSLDILVPLSLGPGMTSRAERFKKMAAVRVTCVCSRPAEQEAQGHTTFLAR
ncbi:unnamed protein product [Cuscuta europaea]|uniref:Transposase (putative) gypsy type domain-containing protein n=1 Tax=Cuscuta europaea TaxID=41803 RepID=A0A9P1EFS1_CUSEU|nr:unnamed protein product [Cuscuta europaea]